MEIVFTVTADVDDGGFSARWDDPTGGGIVTQGENLADLQEMVKDAVAGYFADRESPKAVRLHFIEDPVVA